MIQMEQTLDTATYIEPGFNSIFTAHEHPHWQTLWGDFIGWSMLAGVIVVLLMAGVWIIGKKFPKNFRRLPLSIPFVLVWIYGFVVYDIGMCPTGEKIGLLTNAPLALVYAFKIFLLDSEVSEIQSRFHESWVYSFNFALCHFFAAVISTLFVIKVIGFNILARLNIWWRSLGRKKVEDTFVFWGFNEPSYRLIKDIEAHYDTYLKKNFADLSEKDRNKKRRSLYRVIIARICEEDEAPEEKTGFSRIFDFLTFPSSELIQLEELKSATCLTTGRFVNMKALVTDRREDILGKILGLKSLKRLLKRGTSKNIHMLFLSNAENENLHNVAVLRNDTTLLGVAAKTEPGRDITDPSVDKEIVGGRVTFYCHARNNSVHSVIEDREPGDPVKVRIIDSSHINVEMLKSDKRFLPVNFVDVERDATVSSPFHAMIVGFSEVGRDALGFLYEFGAFAMSDSPSGQSPRSPFRIDVIDKNMDDMAGAFVAGAPAIHPYMPFLQDNNNSTDLSPITLHKMDCNSVEFYMKTVEWIKTLNYIVIGTDNDELNITLGVRLFKAATRYRDNLERFCILVRIHNDDDNRIRAIASHYNSLWRAYEKTKSNEKVEDNSGDADGPLYVFGLDKEIYTYDNIINLIHEKKAADYKKRYNESLPPTVDKEGNKDGKKEEKPSKRRDYLDYLKQRRTWSQNMANSCHELTKQQLLERALDKCGLDKSSYSKITRENNTLLYKGPEQDMEMESLKRIAITLARTEHLRWNASHEFQGYVCGIKDEIRFSHDCLTDWYQLPSDEIKSYDCNVADMILGVSITPSSEK